MISKLRGLSDDKKKLLRNFFSLSVLQAANYLLPLITLPYLVRVLGTEKFGLISFAQAFIQYFAVLTDYGFNLSATRAISIHRKDKGKISEILCSVMLIKATLMILSFGVLSAIVFGFEKFEVDWPVYFLSFGIVVGQVLVSVWFFQGMERMKYITLLNILARGVFTVAIFVFVRDRADYPRVPLFSSMGYIAAGLLSMWIIRNHFGIRFKIPSLSSVVEIFKDGWYIFISSVATNLYTTSNTFVLGLFTNNTVVGCYSAAEKLIRAAQGLFSPVSQTIYPYISKLADESTEKALGFIKKVAILAGSASFMISISLFVFAKPIVDIVLDNQFKSSVPVLKILGFLPFIITLSNIFAVQGLYGFGYYKIVSKYVTLCGVIYLPVVITLTYYFQHIGTAISAITIELVITLLSIYYFAIKYTTEVKPAHV